MTVLQVAALAAVPLPGGGVAVATDPLRQTLVLGIYGLALTMMFFVFQAPDVALSEIVVSTVGLPVMILLALREVPSSARTKEQEESRSARCCCSSRRRRLRRRARLGWPACRPSATTTASTAAHPDRVAERHATDLVTAVNFDFRGFDTLGEEFILFVSVLGVALICASSAASASVRRRRPTSTTSRARASAARARARARPELLVLGVYIVCTAS